MTAKHFILNDNNGKSYFEDGTVPEFSAADFPAGWEALSVEAAGIFFFLFKIEPSAEEFPLHAAPDEYFSYVVKGSGTLFGGDSETKGEHIKFNAGDFISFKPDTQHAWKNGDTETLILFVKKL
ncbi:MAG: cupin domain-containing protein [Lentimonas sp.]